MESTGATGTRGSQGSRPPASGPGWPFDRVVCGIDGSDEAVLAARQARHLAPDVPVTLVHAISVTEDAHRRDYPAWVHARRDAGSRLLDELRTQLALPGAPAPDITVEEGDIPDALSYVTSRAARPLLAIGSGDEADQHLHSFGPAPTGARLSLRIVEAAPCSVLVGRHTAQPEQFPRSIAVGVDGSAPSMHAHAVATRIAAYTGAHITVVVALGGKGADLRSLQRAQPPLTISTITEDKPVKALLEAASHHDLIVVGNRGLHGWRRLGSVSSRIATGSPTSVLVVRQPHHQTSAA